MIILSKQTIYEMTSNIPKKPFYAMTNYLYLILLIFTLNFLFPQQNIFCEDTQLLKAELTSKQALLTYPYNKGKLSFPRDEGIHSPTEFPYTIMEWFAFYSHLTTEDGRKYFLFSTFITYDPIEAILMGQFPHVITTFVDIKNSKTYSYRCQKKLLRFAKGHADIKAADGNYFKWKGEHMPFQYEYYINVKNPHFEYTVDLDLLMIKPPLIINGTGYIKEPKGTSGYYSQTRVKTEGFLTINGVKEKVKGIQWIDRQWLGASFVMNMNYSYQWWSIQLDNNEEAIMFKIWDKTTDTVAMTLLEINHANGKREKVEKFTLKELSTGWQLSAPQVDWNLKIIPACKNQKIWKACTISGTINNKAVKGVGVAELAKNIGKDLAKFH
ncbi:MAG: lipocalin-like domain-containing protein [Verrucomicrobiota bacterium]|nr:lipocalin-like domain-containing protein [Verrucomicrobiota bacterium]